MEKINAEFIFGFNFAQNINLLLLVISKSGFFLKATLWPDFTELFFRFLGVKTGDFYRTSAKKASGFWIVKKRFLSCLVILSDQLTKAAAESFLIFDFSLKIELN